MPDALTGLSIVIPAYNEEHRIASTLERLLSEVGPLNVHEIIVVDDGSVDRTADIVEGLRGQANGTALHLLRHEQNRGKGAALRTGLAASSSATVGYLDADLSVSPKTFAAAGALLKQGADIVVGIRVTPNGAGSRPNQPLRRRLLGRMFVTIQRRIVGLRFRDTQCPFKLMTRRAVETVVPKCSVDGWAFDVELLRVATRESLQVAEIPVHWSHVEGSSVSTNPVTIVKTLRELLAIRRAHRVR